jgi:nucleotide-binding universal stress UspA family protein
LEGVVRREHRDLLVVGSSRHGRATGADVHVDVVQGSPPDELKRLSREVDLLVIGSRRWGAAARVLLGSTGEEVMRDASCAVMVVPRPAG